MVILFPALVFLAGILIMDSLSGYKYVMQQLNARLSRKDARPLYRRPLGYDIDVVSLVWGALDDKARAIEQYSLKLDLAFPLMYGMALGGALLVARSDLVQPLPVFWTLLPVVITMIADWTENLIQIRQLSLYNLSGHAGLQSNWIQIASLATNTKFASLAVSFAMLVCFVRQTTS